MIGTLRGEIIDREPVTERASGVELIVEVAGVGYRVTVTAATLSRLPADEPVLLFIHHHLWEADQKLFGFRTRTERVAFEGLLSAHGVGPNLALAVLATHPVEQLARILAEDDLAALCEVPGVGKKTAQRLLVDLRSSLVLPVLEDGSTIDLTPVGSEDGNGSAANGQASLVDVREAMANLGYSSEEIRRAVSGLGSDTVESADSGQLLKLAILNLANG
ncbi:MAG: Holliday junction branch migration protein RuvA [Actinomycetota bacterium]